MSMFKNFKRMVVAGSGVNDEQIETIYWEVVRDNPDNTKEALKLLEQHRNKVAIKVARIFFEAHLELVEEEKV